MDKRPFESFSFDDIVHNALASPNKAQSHIRRLQQVEDPFWLFGSKNRGGSIPGLPGEVSSTWETHLCPEKGHLRGKLA